jgi:hypothetical protein
LNLSTGDIVFGDKVVFPPPGAGGGKPDDYKSDGAPSDPTGTDDDGDETEEKGVIRAAIVTVSSVAGPVGILDNGEIPDLHVPRLGRVSFLVRTTDGSELAWTNPKDIKLRREYFVCEAPQGAIEVQAYFQPGITGVVTAIREKFSPAIIEN